MKCVSFPSCTAIEPETLEESKVIEAYCKEFGYYAALRIVGKEMLRALLLQKPHTEGYLKQVLEELEARL